MAAAAAWGGCHVSVTFGRVSSQQRNLSGQVKVGGGGGGCIVFPFSRRLLARVRESSGGGRQYSCLGINEIETSICPFAAAAAGPSAAVERAREKIIQLRSWIPRYF